MTPHRIYSLVQNCLTLIEKGKHCILENEVPLFRYEKTSIFIKRICEQVVNDIYNNQYDYNDVKICLIMNYLFFDRISWNILEKNYIISISNLFKQKKFVEDKNFINQLCEKNNINHLNEFFIINSNGKSLIYELVINKYISPMFCIKMYNHLNDSINYEFECSEHKKFRYILRLISNEMKK